jgi:hypothetical protein
MALTMALSQVPAHPGRLRSAPEPDDAEFLVTPSGIEVPRRARPRWNVGFNQVGEFRSY